MEEYWFLAPMSKLAISSASFEYFFSETLHNNLPVTRAKQLRRSMKKTTSCKEATELSGQKNVFLPNQRGGIQPLLELVR